MKICLMGVSVTSGNRGVLALGASLINLCAETCPQSEILLLVGKQDNSPAIFRLGDRRVEIPVVNVRLSPRSRLRDHLFWITAMAVLFRLIKWSRFREFIKHRVPWINAIAEADLVGDIRGGDSFSDIYGFKRFLYGFVLAETVLLVKGSIVQFPQTYGPFAGKTARYLTKILLRKSSAIIARDKQSRAVAQQLVGPLQTILLSPDVAFSLQPVKPATDVSNLVWNHSASKDVIGLNVNGLMYHGGYTRRNMFGLQLDYPSFLVSLINTLLAQCPGEIWLIPHTFAPKGDVESDMDASQILREKLAPDMQTRVRIVDREYDQHELKYLIGQCDFFIGSRMHSCIAALSRGVPCVGVAYSMKFAGVFESVGMEDWVIDGRVADNDQAVARIVELYGRRNLVRQPLGRSAEVARDELRQIFGRLLAAPTPAEELANRAVS